VIEGTGAFNIAYGRWHSKKKYGSLGAISFEKAFTLHPFQERFFGLASSACISVLCFVYSSGKFIFSACDRIKDVVGCYQAII
jgi:hypothetical protein